MSNTLSIALSIEVVSDPVCPWCYIGERRLASAIEQCPDLDFEVSWLPFQLNPNMPQDGMDRQAYYKQKYGEDSVEKLFADIRDAGLAEGIAFDYKPDARAPNTLLAHSLLYLARDAGLLVQTKLAEKLFYAHHVECTDIGDLDVLVPIAGEVQMDEGVVREALLSGSVESDVKELIQAAVARGISGVPFFVINADYGISGAQPAENLVAAFRQLEANAQKN
jgi:predicted DsbA family dithiol-disulfide isomerase